MSKELPYFRFTAFEWLNDDISLEDFESKGVFIDVCAYYWFKDCSITRAMLEKRFSNAKTIIESLFKSEIIKTKNGSDFIDIKFLNDQFDELSELRKQRQNAGSKGGKQKASKAKAKLKQNPSYKDKDKDKDKDKNIYADFVKMTTQEYEKLIKEHGEANTQNFILILDNYKGSKGKIYKDDYRAILSWVIDKTKREGTYISHKSKLDITDPRMIDDRAAWQRIKVDNE